MTSLLRVENLTKRFPGVVANDKLNLDVRHGEIYALLGENGAGKSTLMNVVYGLLEPDEGRILWRGNPISVASPREAISLGIGMVHQHFMLVPALTVLENVVLGLNSGWRFDMAAARRKLLALAEEFRQPIDPDAKVRTLSVGEQQRVEILKALYRDAELLILDEPTAVLTPQEATQLFSVCRSLAERGKSVVFITHKLSEIMALSNRVTILRNGRSVTTVDTADTNPNELARLMVGHEISLSIPKGGFAPGKTVLEVADLACVGDHGQAAVRGVSFTVREGEIVGFAGVDGNGQTELMEAIVGLRPVTGGAVRLRGDAITGRSMADLIRQGVSYVPGDRHSAAIVGDMPLEENALLGFSHQRPYVAGGFIQRSAVCDLAGAIVRDYKVKTVSTATVMNTLSGGNQQRFVMGRAVSHNPDLFVVVQPSRGLDIASTDFVRKTIVRLRDAGKAVLLVSMDLDEIMALSDRIEVIHHGRIVGTVPPTATREQIGLLVAGGSTSSHFKVESVEHVPEKSLP